MKGEVRRRVTGRRYLVRMNGKDQLCKSRLDVSPGRIVTLEKVGDTWWIIAA